MKQIYLKKYTKNEHKNSDLSDPAIFCLPHVKNLHNNDLFLTTTAVDLRSRLDFFSANLKQRGVRLLKSEVKKKHSLRETCQSGQILLVTPNKLKAQLPKNCVPKSFFVVLFYI